MTALWTLTREYPELHRDRAALFWTLAFALFIVMFGLIFQGGGESRLTLAWVDSDGSPQSAESCCARRGVGRRRRGSPRGRGAREDADRRSRRRDRRAGGVRWPARSQRRVGHARRPAVVRVYTDPSQQSLQGSVYQAVGSVLAVINMNDRPPLVMPQPETIQTENLNFISYFVPSMLGCR